MTDDPFLCPECGANQASVFDALVQLEPLFRVECAWCEYRWNVRAPKDAFHRD